MKHNRRKVSLTVCFRYRGIKGKAVYRISRNRYENSSRAPVRYIRRSERIFLFYLILLYSSIIRKLEITQVSVFLSFLRRIHFV